MITLSERGDFNDLGQELQVHALRVLLRRDSTHDAARCVLGPLFQATVVDPALFEFERRAFGQIIAAVEETQHHEISDDVF